MHAYKTYTAATSAELTDWLSPQLEAVGNRPQAGRVYAEENTILALTGDVVDAIRASGKTQAEIAETLGVSDAYVSQLLSGVRNMTMKTVGALLWTCGLEVRGMRIGQLGMAKPTPYRVTSLEPVLKLGRCASGWHRA